MPTQGRSKPSYDKQDVLDRNAGIDRTVVAAYKRLERELKQLGLRCGRATRWSRHWGSGRPRDRNLTAGQPDDIRLQNGQPRT